jgi:hypothetical protein
MVGAVNSLDVGSVVRSLFAFQHTSEEETVLQQMDNVQSIASHGYFA